MIATASPMIELRRVFRWFGPTCAVNDVSFEVAAGEVVGYIGPNGAGKTTSMRILATLETPSAGDAFVDGFSVVNDPDRVRKRLGFMPDYFGTYSNINCLEYLDFYARAYGLVGRERSRALRHVLDFTGLDKLAEKPIRGLSKGMKQRLCLGRSMIHDPAVLILDEPAAGLDPRARIELREMIGNLAADGKALLVSSHILTELGEMCDRIAIIEQGSILATGSVAEILQRLETGTDIRAQRVATVTVELLQSTDAAMQWLRDNHAIEELQQDQLRISFPFPKDRDLQAKLLRDMIHADLEVVGFSQRETTLEQVFLEVTRGQVQ